MLKDSHLRLIPIQSHFAETRELALEKLAAKKADGSVVTRDMFGSSCVLINFAKIKLSHGADADHEEIRLNSWTLNQNPDIHVNNCP